MNKKLYTQANKNIVVSPSTRREGSDASHENQSRHQSSLHQLFNEVGLSACDIDNLSTKVLHQTHATINEIGKLKKATFDRNSMDLEESAHRMVGLCSDLGTMSMLRLCYQILINARLGEIDKINKLLVSLENEFYSFKKSLMVAV